MGENIFLVHMCGLSNGSHYVMCEKKKKKIKPTSQNQSRSQQTQGISLYDVKMSHSQSQTRTSNGASYSLQLLYQDTHKDCEMV